MDPLKEYLNKLDSSQYDGRDSTEINSEFQNLINELESKKLYHLIPMAELNRQAFAINKSFDFKENLEKGTVDGLSWTFAGTQTSTDGTVTPIYWPDVQKLTDDNFKYFETRYGESVNLYIKTEYGLLTYFGRKTKFSKSKLFHQQLFKELFELSVYYEKLTKQGGEKNFSIIYFYNTIKLCFYMAVSSKLKDELVKIVEYLTELHKTWKLDVNPKTRIISDITALFSNNFSSTKSLVDFEQLANRNLLFSDVLEKENPWNSINLMDISIKIAQKINIDRNPFLLKKANAYEILMEKAKDDSNITAVTYVKNALDIYKILKDKDSITRLSNEYKNLRGKFHLTTFKQELSKEFSEKIEKVIDNTVNECSKIEILHHFITTPWYEKYNETKERSEELASSSVLLSLIPAVIVDKFGNTVEIFQDETEKKEHNFWTSFGNNFQIGTQTMCNFFIRAFMADKLDFESTLNYLKNTWFAEPIKREYHGEEVIIYPIDTLIPALYKFFQDLEEFKRNNTHKIDYVLAIESLTLRVEGLIRYFCEKAGIMTFKKKQRNGDSLMMEKLLDDLLSDLKFNEEKATNVHFDQNHWNLIKFVMTAKSGWNLRNMVAHSLLDYDEYTFEKAVVIFSIIMKLSAYNFRTDKKEES